MSALDQFEGLPIFAGVPASTRERLRRAVRIDDYRDDQTIFVQGDEVRGALFIMEGFVKLIRVARNGDQTIIQILPAGRAIAEAFALGGGLHTTSAAAVGAVVIARIPAPILKRELQLSPALSLAMFAETRTKIAALMDMIEALKVQSADERVARYILSLCPRGADSCEVEFPHHKRLVAELLGIQQATLSRCLAKLRDQGVATDARAISISSVSRLLAALSGAAANPGYERRKMA